MSSKIKGLRRVGIVGLSTVVAASMMSLSAVSAQASWDDDRTVVDVQTQTNAEIGLVDTDVTPVDNGTQGATLVVPGVNAQAIGDIRLLIPNSFANGDTIDLTIFDRTATATSDGQINADTAHKLGFTAVPTVTVDPKPYVAGTSIGDTSDVAGNTENVPVADVSATKATTPPVFTKAVVESSRALGLAKDIIRLTVSGVQDAGDPTNEWIVTLSDLTVDVGTATSPGELRVVPFAYNGTPASNFANASLMFRGNVADEDGLAGFDPIIGIYTVPAYVSPVNFNIGAPNNIVADGATQRIGDITIAETNNSSLQADTYTVTVVGATIMNDDDVVVTATNAATGETVVTPATNTGSVLSFVLNQTDPAAANAGKVTIKLTGLLLADSSEGTITYTLDGGSISDFLITPAGSSPAIGALPADSDFSDGVNQTDIQAPGLQVKATSTPIAFRIGGIDRYETAAKIALANGFNPEVVLASGMDFPDALSSGYLASTVGGSILLTKQNVLPASTIQAMRELGTKTVYIIGGTGAISAGIEAQLRATSQYQPGGTVTIGQGKLSVVRLGGANRFETNRVVNIRAAALSEDANPVGRTTITFGEASKLTALVARGEDFADAMAGGPATAGVFFGGGQGSLPLILTKSGSLSPAASSQFTSLGIEQAVVLGGTGAVAAAVATSIEALGADVYRIGGADRFETAAMVADFEIATVTPTATTDGGLGFDSFGSEDGERAYLARGDDFADALAGAPLAGGEGSPILLTNPTTLSGPTQVWLSDHFADYSRVIALGLGGAVSTAVLNAANNAIAGG